jgi:microcin C transport system substrate-binding protein
MGARRTARRVHGSAQAFIFNLRDPKFQTRRPRAIRLMFNFRWSNETLFYGYMIVSILSGRTLIYKRAASMRQAVGLLQPSLTTGF